MFPDLNRIFNDISKWFWITIALAIVGAVSLVTGIGFALYWLFTHTTIVFG